MHFCRILDHVSTDLGFDFLQVLKLKFVFFVSLRLDPPDFHFSKQRGTAVGGKEQGGRRK